MKIRTWLTVAAAALATVLAPSAGAQSNYPDRPIRLIVPFPPGGTSDVVGRIFAEALGKLTDAVNRRHRRMGISMRSIRYLRCSASTITTSITRRLKTMNCSTKRAASG